VIQATKDIILEAVNSEYLLEIEDEIFGFLNQTPTQMLTHLRNRGGALDFADTKALLVEQDGECYASKVPQLYFNRVEKAILGLTCASINSDLDEHRNMAHYFLKASGKFDAAVREWEHKSAAQKTWGDIKLSSHRSMERKTSRTNLLQKKSEQTTSMSKPKQQKNSLLH
jgi:hypothetical protein